MDKVLNNMNMLAKYNYIGDWLIDKYNDEELKNEIHRRANIDFLGLLNREIQMVDMDSYLFLSLVYIGMDHYDQNYYNNLSDYYPDAFNQFSDQHINNKIREYVRFFRNIKDDDNVRIIDYILKESFIPQYYLSGFYKFLYDIFAIDYDYDFPQEREDNDLIQETEKEIRSILYQIMQQASGSTSDEVKIKINGSYKNYILTKGTILALTDQESLQSLVPIIVKMLNLFHADFWGEDIKGIALNKHLLKGFESWETENTVNISDKSSTKSTRGQTLKPRIIKYDASAEGIILRTRRHIINGAIDTDNIEVRIYNGESLLDVYGIDKLRIKRSMGGLRIEPMSVVLKSFLSELRYVVLHNNIEIYSTFNNLYFDFLIFDRDFDRLSNFNDYNDDVLIISKDKMLSSNFTEVKSKAYYMYTGKLNQNMVLHFENSNIILSDKEKIMLTGYPEGVVEATYNGKSIDVYSELSYLYIDTTDEDFESLILSVNSKKYKLVELSSTVKVEEIRYATLNLESIVIVEGLNTIRLVNSKLNKDSFSFIYDPKLLNSFDVNNDLSINHHISSSLFKSENIHYSNEKLKTEEITVQIKELFVNGSKLEYKFKVLFDHYMINDKMYYLSKFIWFPKLETSIYVNSDNIISYEIITNGVISYNEQFTKASNGLIISNNEIEHHISNATSGVISINVTKEDGEVFTLIVHKYNIYNPNDYVLIPEKESLQLKIKYIGENKMSVEYECENSKSKRISLTNDRFSRISVDANTEYKLKIVEGEGYNPFLQNSISKEHQVLHYCYLNVDRLVENSFFVRAVYLDEDSEADHLRGVVLEKLYIDENDIVRGILSYHERDSEILHEFDTINPVKVEFLHDVTINGNINQTPILAYMTESDDDGLMLDKYGCTIDTNENPKYGPINHFKMILREKIK